MGVNKPLSLSLSSANLDPNFVCLCANKFGPKASGLGVKFGLGSGVGVKFCLGSGLGVKLALDPGLGSNWVLDPGFGSNLTLDPFLDFVEMIRIQTIYGT